MGSPVDFEHGLRSCMARKELHLRVIKAFVAARAMDSSAMHAAMNVHNFEAVRFTSQSAIFGARSLGAFRLAELATDLCRAANGQPAATLAPAMKAYLGELTRVLQELVHYTTSADMQPYPDRSWNTEV